MDVARRVASHQKGKGARYTRSRLPVRLVYMEEVEGRSAGLRREWEIKHLTRMQKRRLVESACGLLEMLPVQLHPGAHSEICEEGEAN